MKQTKSKRSFILIPRHKQTVASGYEKTGAPLTYYNGNSQMCLFDSPGFGQEYSNIEASKTQQSAALYYISLKKDV
jgi:GTP-binding protein EngB required for normal cell division